MHKSRLIDSNNQLLHFATRPKPGIPQVNLNFPDGIWISQTVAQFLENLDI